MLSVNCWKATRHLSVFFDTGITTTFRLNLGWCFNTGNDDDKIKLYLLIFVELPLRCLRRCFGQNCFQFSGVVWKIPCWRLVLRDSFYTCSKPVPLQYFPYPSTTRPTDQVFLVSVVINSTHLGHLALSSLTVKLTACNSNSSVSCAMFFSLSVLKIDGCSIILGLQANKFFSLQTANITNNRLSR